MIIYRNIYTAIILVLLLAILLGLAMYKPAQLHSFSRLFSSWQIPTVHFITVPTVILFTVAHCLLALKVESIRLVKSMFL